MPTAIVTGGAIRIGRAMALHLADKGFNIALLYHHSRTAGDETIRSPKSFRANNSSSLPAFTTSVSPLSLKKYIFHRYNFLQNYPSLLFNRCNILDKRNNSTVEIFYDDLHGFHAFSHFLIPCPCWLLLSVPPCCSFGGSAAT